MKINENLIRRQTEAVKVAAAELEKKKTQDAALLTTFEKKVISKRKNPSGGEKDKEIVGEASKQATTKPQSKKQKVEKICEAEEYADACQTPQIEPSTFYPLRARELKKQKILLLRLRLTRRSYGDRGPQRADEIVLLVY
jgi:hypothetical protein